MKTAIAITSFCAGFFFACICCADAIKQGKLDDVFLELKIKQRFQ